MGIAEMDHARRNVARTATIARKIVRVRVGNSALAAHASLQARAARKTHARSRPMRTAPGIGEVATTAVQIPAFATTTVYVMSMRQVQRAVTTALATRGSNALPEPVLEPAWTCIPRTSLRTATVRYVGTSGSNSARRSDTQLRGNAATTANSSLQFAGCSCGYRVSATTGTIRSRIGCQLHANNQCTTPVDHNVAKARRLRAGALRLMHVLSEHGS